MMEQVKNAIELMMEEDEDEKQDNSDGEDEQFIGQVQWNIDYNIIKKEVMYQCVDCYTCGLLGKECGRNGYDGVFVGHYIDKKDQIMARWCLK